MIRRAGQLHHQVGAEGREAIAFGFAQRLPALKPHQAGVGAAHGTIGELEATRAVKHLPAALAISPELETHQQARVAGAGTAAGGGHLNKGAIGIKFEHRLRVGGTDFSELIWGEAERAGQGEHEGPAAEVKSV